MSANQSNMEHNPPTATIKKIRYLSSPLQENLMTADLQFITDEIRDLDSAIAKLKIHGDRYPAEEQKRVQN